MTTESCYYSKVLCEECKKRYECIIWDKYLDLDSKLFNVEEELKTILRELDELVETA